MLGTSTEVSLYETSMTAITSITAGTTANTSGTSPTGTTFAQAGRTDSTARMSSTNGVGSLKVPRFLYMGLLGVMCFQ